MNYRKALLLELLFGGIITICGYLMGSSQQAVSAAVGAGVISASIGLMIWAFQRIFEKKSVALAGLVIVIKYALLAVVIYWIAKQGWADLAWLSLGVGSVVFTAIVYTLTTKNELME